jgi:hypothetical protein
VLDEKIMLSHTQQESIHRNPEMFHQHVRHIEEVFNNQPNKLLRVKEIARKVKERIEKIDPFIQQSTEAVCPRCTNVCCINKHGYHNSEDLIYIYALDLKLPDYNFDGDDSSPCQFLSDKGCAMHRSVRPSGCNWYFCDSLLDHMEERPGYGKFDDGLRDVAELWLALIDEFQRVIKGMETE